ncbi:hypothetical protein [Maribacter polysaccharolyticus]|uniref:hypothetical protein n=1 Tax=Maribacter polysaccharolyticus TaxID=3020831 RepID=UPI00237F62A5|nr:hypothetical protein [Maribacter polysaccharolyticus]MDE3743071.1 hypothetical protein [Maribacter polysaccharolyticus]
MIKINGFYLGKGRVYEDWHAGVNIKSQNYIVLKFFKDGTVIKKSSWIYLDEIQKNLNKFLEDVTNEINKNNDVKKLLELGYWIGNFIEEDKIIEIEFQFNESKYIDNYTILSSDIILSNDLDEFQFEKI